MNPTTGSVFSIIHELFIQKYDFAFKLILLSLFFDVFRPDKLLFGFRPLIYFPLVLLILLFAIWLQTPNKVSHNTQTKVMFAFLLLMIIQVVFARHEYRAFLRLKGFFLYGIPGFLVMTQFMNTSFKIDRYIRLFVILNIFTALLGIIRHGKVPLPIMEDENDFCLLMNILVPFSFFLAQDANKPKNRIFYHIVMLLFVTANISTFS